MPENRLQETCARLGLFIGENLPSPKAHTGYLLVLVDTRTGDYSIADNVSRPETPRTYWLEGILGGERGRRISPIIDPGQFDPLGGVLPRGGIRSLPSGKKPR